MNIEIKKRKIVFKAYHKPHAQMYHQYRINGKRVTYGEYEIKRKKLSLWQPFVKSYVTFTRSGNVVEVDEI